MTELHLTLKDGTKKTILVSEIDRLQGYMGVETIQAGKMAYAGPLYEYILLKTKIGDIEVPRSPENDKEILDFILSR